MSQFWVKVDGQADAQGPWPIDEIKRRAERGLLLPEHMVSTDGRTWQSASDVAELFDPVAAAPATVTAVPRIAHAPPGERRIIPPVINRPPEIPAGSLGYYAPRTDSSVMLRPRSTIAFLIFAGLMLLASIFAIIGAQVFESPWITIGSVVVYLILSIPTLVFWVMWVHGAHKDLRALTHGAYSISPGQAVGFSFIPLFDAFWVVYMPYRLSVELNRHLASRGQARISTGGVMTCQILSILFAVTFSGLTPIMYGISMQMVQGGLHRLSR